MSKVFNFVDSVIVLLCIVLYNFVEFNLKMIGDYPKSFKELKEVLF